MWVENDVLRAEAVTEYWCPLAKAEQPVPIFIGSKGYLEQFSFGIIGYAEVYRTKTPKEASFPEPLSMLF